MFHILFPYKLFVSLSSRAYKGSRIGTIKALTLSSPNTVNERMLQTPPRGWLRQPQLRCWPGCRHWDAAGAFCSPAHPSQGQGDAGRDRPEIGLLPSGSSSGQKVIFFVLVISKNTSASSPRSGCFLHHNHLGKCARWGLATFFVSLSLNGYRK